MENFYNETLIDIRNSGHKISDIEFINIYWCWDNKDEKYDKTGRVITWEDFEKEFSHFEYDSGYGSDNFGHGTAQTVIVFNDGSWLERAI